MEKQVVKLPRTTCTTRKWPHPHVPIPPASAYFPCVEMRANNLTDVVVLSFWTLQMKISTMRHVCEGLTRPTTPTHFAVVRNACLWTTSPVAAAVPGDCGCWASLGWYIDAASQELGGKGGRMERGRSEAGGVQQE